MIRLSEKRTRKLQAVAIRFCFLKKVNKQNVLGRGTSSRENRGCSPFLDSRSSPDFPSSVVSASGLRGRNPLCVTGGAQNYQGSLATIVLRVVGLPLVGCACGQTLSTRSGAQEERCGVRSVAFLRNRLSFICGRSLCGGIHGGGEPNATQVAPEV